MAKQPEQILEEQLLAQSKRLGYGMMQMLFVKPLKTKEFKTTTLSKINLISC